MFFRTGLAALTIDIIFDGPPGNAPFVEVENERGESIRIGERNQARRQTLGPADRRGVSMGKIKSSPAGHSTHCLNSNPQLMIPNAPAAESTVMLR